MQELDLKIKSHLFICCRQRDNKACCASQNSEQWVSDLKSWVKKQGLKSQVRVSKSSCLGFCESGVTAVFYPQNKWYHHLKESDLETLREMLGEYAK